MRIVVNAPSDLTNLYTKDEILNGSAPEGLYANETYFAIKSRDLAAFIGPGNGNYGILESLESGSARSWRFVAPLSKVSLAIDVTG